MSGFRYSDIPAFLHPLMAHVQYFVLNPRLFHGSLVYKVISQRTTIEPLLKQAGIYQDMKNVDEELLQILLEPALDQGARDVFLSIYGGPAGPKRESLLEAIAKKNRSNMAVDAEGARAYLTTSQWQLDYCINEWPGIAFNKTREINEKNLLF